VTHLLQTEFANREPVWGWLDNTVEIMVKQNDYAADHGLAFWAFVWHSFNGKPEQCPKNVSSQ
jgi:hypothetical protein